VAVVECFMAAGAQGNQVGVAIRTLLTAQLFVMDLQVLARPADLTLPPVPLHYLLAELFIRAGI
jgi:hypothetical protein